MRAALAECARIDEAKDIRDRAEALRAYARQRDDRDLEVWTSEIKLRANWASASWSRSWRMLGRGDRGKVQAGGLCSKSKDEAIADAGLSRATAYDYQTLAGGRDERAHKAASAAAEHYFAKARAEREPGTMEGLRGTIRNAVEEVLGPPPARRPAQRMPEEAGRFNDWTGAVETLSKAPDDLGPLARRLPALTGKFLAEAKGASRNLERWILSLELEMEGKDDVVA